MIIFYLEGKVHIKEMLFFMVLVGILNLSKRGQRLSGTNIDHEIPFSPNITC